MSKQTDRLTRRLQAIPKAVKLAVEPALIKAGVDLSMTMRLLAPVDTGDLRDSIHVTLPGETTPPYSQPGGATTALDNQVLITAGDEKVRYPHLVEYGTADTRSAILLACISASEKAAGKPDQALYSQGRQREVGELMEPSLELQKAIRASLVASSALTSLVTAANIVDRNGIPAVFPCVLIGEGQTTPDVGIARNRHVVFTDLQIWAKETGLVTSKQIAGAIRAALIDTRWSIPGLHIADLHIVSSCFMRDPNGINSHGVISLQASVLEVAL